MKSRYRSYLMLLTALLTSCHPGTIQEAINNTGEEVTVVSLDTKFKETPYQIRDQQTARIKTPYKLRIENRRGVWNYDLTPVPRAFQKRVGINMYVETFQIEPDGTIYAVLPDSSGPMKNLPAQPPGYPIKPK